MPTKTDVADVFVELYDELVPREVLNRVDRWRTQRAFDAVAHEACAAALDGTYACQLDHARETLEGQRERVAHLTGLDWALKRINPCWQGGESPEHLASLRVRYALDLRLNTNPRNGLLLPKLTLDHRPIRVPDRMIDLFSAVVRVRPRKRPRVRLQAAPRDMSMSRDERIEGIRVACLPMMRDLDELEIRLRERDGALRYHIRPRKLDVLAGRIAGIVEALAADGALLAFAPELACSDELLEVWQERCRDAVGASSALRWVFVGTGNTPESDPPSNTGMLLDATTGDVLVRQLKQFRFNISPTQQAGHYRLPGMDGSETIYEDIDIGEKVNVLEMHAARLAVLICEDLSHVEMLLEELFEYGVTHILAPVFSKEVLPHYWEHAKAKDYEGAVLVANSLVIGYLNGGGEIGAALVHTKEGELVQTASDPTELIRFVLRDGKPPEGLDKPFAKP